MYGSLFSLKNFCRKMSPLDYKDGFLTYSTSSYVLSLLETYTGLKFVVNTDLQCTGVRALLEKIYSQVRCSVAAARTEKRKWTTSRLSDCIVNNLITFLLQVFVEYVVKSPLWSPGKPIRSELFKARLDDVVAQYSSTYPTRSA